MISNVQYIVDNLGNKVSVIVPYMDWEKMQKWFDKLEYLENGDVKFNLSDKEIKELIEDIEYTD